MPAIEGLLPSRDNDIVLDMIFELQTWHVLAKLRLHTSVTLDIFRKTTDYLYKVVREFSEKTCTNYDTVEQPSETQSRVRREAKSKKKTNTSRKRKTFNVMNTYKYHSLGHYVDYIARYGPTDIYTTQVVSPCIRY